MSADPHDQLLLQIRGAVAEYERTLIAERMRARAAGEAAGGHAAAVDHGAVRVPAGSQRPRRADAVRVDPGGGGAGGAAVRLVPRTPGNHLPARPAADRSGGACPRGGPRWNTASVRGILRNPSYAGGVLSGPTEVAPARGRKVPLTPPGPGRQPCPAAAARLDRGAGPAGRLRELRPGAGQAGRQPGRGWLATPATSTCCGR